MAAVGQEHGETVITLSPCQIGRNTTGRRDSLDRSPATTIGSKHDRIVSGPRSAASVGCVAQRLGRTTADRDLPKLSLCKESNVAAVGRPERISGILGTQHWLSLKRIQWTEPKLPLSLNRRRDGYIA